MSDTDQTQESKTPRPGKHKARAREQSIERILDAAEQLFAEFGYHGVTLKDVAARIGVSSTLIHYHFNGKESLYEAVWARRAPISRPEPAGGDAPLCRDGGRQGHGRGRACTPG
jgi:AraC-like DNA-binding protein